MPKLIYCKRKLFKYSSNEKQIYFTDKSRPNSVQG